MKNYIKILTEMEISIGDHLDVVKEKMAEVEEEDE